jgi:hypothetical protein
MLGGVELRELRIFLAVLVAAMRETGAQRSLVPRAAVPRQARVSFARALPCLIALWALADARATHSEGVPVRCSRVRSLH